MFKDSLQQYAYGGVDAGVALMTPIFTPRRSLRTVHAVAESKTTHTSQASASSVSTNDPDTLNRHPTASSTPTYKTPAKGRPGKSSLKRGPSDTHIPSPVTLPSPAAKKKRTRESSKYASPAKYAHLPPLTDILAPNLICVFVGTNPGIRTSTAGHAYAHPSNSFWKLLHSSGCTSRRLRPDEDGTLPRDWSLGNTNIVERPTKDAAELSKAEMCEGAVVLERKMARCKPEAVCIVGKGIWEAIWRSKYGRNPTKEEFRWGWQDERENMGNLTQDDDGDDDDDDSNGVTAEAAEDDKKSWDGTRVYVTTSTSGLSASLKPAEKEAIWRPFGEWVQQRRLERAADETSSAAKPCLKVEKADVETEEGTEATTS